MKRNFIKLSAGIAFTALTFGSFAQKKNVTDAIMTFKKYNPMSNGIEPSKKTAEEARKYIDLAAVNPETAEDFKMHLYRAEIYYSMIEIATLDAAKTPIDDAKMKEYETISKASFKKVLDDPKKTYTSDAQNFMGMRSDLMFNQGIEAYNNKKYDESLNAFLVSYYLRTFINEEYKDAEINTTLSLNNYVDKLIDAKEFDKAIEAVNNVLEIFPNNIDALISMVNIYLQKGDVANTETYINKALAIDAKNKQLYYILGTSYIELKQNEKAAEALSKAIEIDPAIGIARRSDQRERVRQGGMTAQRPVPMAQSVRFGSASEGRNAVAADMAAADCRAIAIARDANGRIGRQRIVCAIFQPGAEPVEFGAGQGQNTTDRV